MPAVAVEATVTVMIDVPAPGIDVGLNPTMTPVGCPDAVNATAELKPPVTELVIVDVPELPSATDTEVGDAEMLKPGAAAAVTVSETCLLYTSRCV